MKLILLATTALFPLTLAAESYTAPMIPDAVTVFPQGAIVQSRLVLDLPTGQHDVSFLVPNTAFMRMVPQIAVLGGNVTTTKTKPSPDRDTYDFLTEDQQSVMDTHRELEAEISALEAQIAEKEQVLNGLRTQASYLAALKPSTDAPQSLEDIQAIFNYLPDALKENAAQQAGVISEIDGDRAELADLRKLFEKSEDNIRQLGLPSENWMQVQLDIAMDAAGEVSILVDAFQPFAGWNTLYDVRLNEGNGTIALDREAAVYQNTGQGWNDVTITLTSAKPLQSLNPIPVRRDTVDTLKAEKTYRSALSSADMAEPMMAPEIVMESAGAFSETSGSFDGVAVDFAVAGRTTVAVGDQNGSLIPLAPVQVDATVDRYANARTDETAFVRARLTNDTGEPILSGQGRWYRDGHLIGSDAVGFIASGADATLYFGPDETLPVSLTFLNEMSGDQAFISRNNVRDEEIGVAVKNLGSDAQNVVLTYATPVSVNEDVDVDLRLRPQPDRTDVDGEPGVVEWDFDLAPGQSEDILMNFRLSWPDGSQINWTR